MIAYSLTDPTSFGGRLIVLGNNLNNTAPIETLKCKFIDAIFA